MIVRTSGGLWGPSMSIYCHLLAQLLLAAYQQPGRDVSGSHNGQIGAQMSPLDGPMRFDEVPVHRPSSRDAPCTLAQLPAAQRRLTVTPICCEKGLHSSFPCPF